MAFLSLAGWRSAGLSAALALAVFVLTRLALLVHATLVSGQPLATLAAGFALGMLRDLPVAAVLALPWLWFASCFTGPRALRLRLPLLFVYVFVLLFVAVSEGIFWDEFGVRFNFIALDYLVFTTEVIGNIRESYPVGPIVAALIGASLLIVGSCRRVLQVPQRQNPAQPGGRRWRQLPALLVISLLAGLAYWKVPPAEFSSNGFANELADNGWRSFIWAARQNRLDYRQFYATRPDAEVLRDLQRLSGHATVSATHAPVHKVAYHAPQALGGKQPNVVVVMMESFSAEYMATFGNREGLTPNLDRLAGEGLLFSRLYAAGTRTVRGLEALSAALPPLPGKSVVRWPKVSNLNTLGASLAEHGWQPHFLYGGYGAFDNMNAYFAAQGYQVTDRTGFQDGIVEFENIWGVADEHLFDQVLLEIDRDHAAGKPFFGHVMTASNHVPFTYPEGRIDIPSPGKRRGGVKYADYAVGRFIEMAKQKPWFDNTVFLFVADHCASSAGKTKIPVDRYHIPAVLYAPKWLKPGRVDTLASQIDLAPTLLGLLGISYESTFFGRNLLLQHPLPGRAPIGNYQHLGLFDGHDLAILSPRRGLRQRRDALGASDEQPGAPTDPLIARAIAYYQGASYALRNHLLGWH